MRRRRCWTAKADADISESIAVPHGTVGNAKRYRVLKTGVVFCRYPEGVRFGEEDDIARLVIGIAARNNELLSRSSPA